MARHSTSRLFLGPGDIFEKVMTKTKPDVDGIIFEIADGSPADRRSPAGLYDKSVFVITFRKIVPRT